MNRWIIPDGYLPRKMQQAVAGHEALCFLNTSEYDASVELKIYFEDKDPISGFNIIIPAKRTIHYILDNTTNDKGMKIPTNTPYAIEVISDVDLAIQFTRVDTRQPNLALFTTIIDKTV